MTFEVVGLVYANGIMLFYTSPHVTLALQSLGMTVFKPSKDYFFKVVCAFFFIKNNFLVSKWDFAVVIKHLFDYNYILNVNHPAWVAKL